MVSLHFNVSKTYQILIPFDWELCQKIVSEALAFSLPCNFEQKVMDIHTGKTLYRVHGSQPSLKESDPYKSKQKISARELFSFLF